MEVLKIFRLKHDLSYDPDSGEFRWLINRQRARAGALAGTICPMYGYRLICINYCRYRAARLAWFYMTGEWPSEMVDHIDHDRANDAWNNLRLATCKQNQENRSGVLGVTWQPGRNKWMAQIRHYGKSYNLGRFAKFEDAIAARRSAEREMFTHAAA